MKIGEYQIIPLNIGQFKLDGGAMFGVVPKVIWSKTNPSDDLNRIDMCTSTLLLTNGKRNILIDTGVGNKMSKKFNDIYCVDNSKFNIDSALLKYGLTKESITDVILTHLHFDHCGGSTYFDENKELKITFPNAEFYVQKNHYEWGINPSERDKASFINNNFQILSDKKVLKLIDGEYKFDDYITLIPVNGHTRNMQVVKISDGKNTLLHTADLIPMSAHIPLPYIMGYDLFPVITLEEKRKFLTDAVNGNWYLFFEHDQLVNCAEVQFNEFGFSIKSNINLNEI
jgi:glyoxylase-like metal-dependent hydrolase (beta-lactamase superfamily II)